MKKIYYLFNVLIVSLFFSCGKLDNYAEPGETLKGSLIDVVTNKPLITEQPNGFKILLLESSWSANPQPQTFWGKADGTFTDTKLFTGTYKVIPIEGAFFPVDTATVKLSGVVSQNFNVTPYLTVTATSSVSSGNLNVSYTISRSKIGDKIIDSRVFVSTNPNVGNNIFTSSLSPFRDLSSIDDSVILTTTFNETISGLVAGKTYYVRVGARTNNPSKRYNFTEIKAVTP